MQKNQKILIIIIGTVLLVSMLATSTSASPMTSATDASKNQPFSAQFPDGSSGVSCSACHSTEASMEKWAQNYAGSHAAYKDIYRQFIDAHTSSQVDNVTVDLNLSQEMVYTLLNHQPAEQSIQLKNYSDPIVQCMFCHTGQAGHVYLLNTETD